MRKFVLPFLCSLLFILFLVQCSEKIEPGTTTAGGGPAVAVRVMDVRSGVQPVVYDAVGTVKARLAATVSSKLMGVIRAFNVKEGDEVKKGDLLVVIDDRQVAAQLAQAQAALAEAKRAEAGAVSARSAAAAGARRASLSYQRNRTMLEGGAITQEMFETVDAQNKQAQASLAQAEAMVEAARFRVEQAQASVDAASVAMKDARVLAPFDGRVTAKDADAGALASPGMPLLALEREGGYRVDLMVPENYIQSVHINEPVDVRISATGEKAINGTVKVIVPSADPSSRTFTVQVDIPTVPGLRSGMFARAPLTVGEQKTLRIPRPAVVQQGQLTGVYIVDADNTARFRLIRIGRTDDDQVEIISGIGDNTRLVVDPPAQLKNGSHVELAK